MIDPGKVRHLRTDRGLSQRQLAAAIGVDPLTVKRLEDGADCGDLPLRVVERLTATLGVPVTRLIADEPGPGSDVELAPAIGAALLSHGRVALTGLAEGLNRSASEVDQAIRDAGAHLAKVGMSIAGHGDERWLAPLADAQHLAPRENPLNLAEARLLRRIGRGEDVRPILSGNDRQFILPSLLRKGLVTTAGGKLEITDDVRGCLLID